MSKMCIYFVAYNDWVYQGCFDMINVCVSRVWTIFNLTQWVINGLHCSIRPKWMYRSALLRKMQMTSSLPHPKNERQQSINEFWRCVMKYPVGCAVTVRHNQTIGRLSIEQWWSQHFYYVLKMSIQRASTIIGLVSWKLIELCGHVTP